MPHDQVVVPTASTTAYETWVHAIAPPSPTTSATTPMHESTSFSNAAVPTTVPPPTVTSIAVPGFVPATGAGFTEVLRPLTDPLVRRAWDLYQQVEAAKPTPSWRARAAHWLRSRVNRGPAVVFLPTVMLTMLDMLTTYVSTFDHRPAGPGPCAK